jgi:hypothetical protein
LAVITTIINTRRECIATHTFGNDLNLIAHFSGIHWWLAANWCILILRAKINQFGACGCATWVSLIETTLNDGKLVSLHLHIGKRVCMTHGRSASFEINYVNLSGGSYLKTIHTAADMRATHHYVEFHFNSDNPARL